MADVLAWLGQDVGPAPDELTHFIIASDPFTVIYVSQQGYDALRSRGAHVNRELLVQTGTRCCECGTHLPSVPTPGSPKWCAVCVTSPFVHLTRDGNYKPAARKETR